MDIHSLIITTTQGNILYSRYCDPSTELQNILQWETTLYALTVASWEEAKVAQQIATEG
jgi:hypothetical protein